MMSAPLLHSDVKSLQLDLKSLVNVNKKIGKSKALIGSDRDTVELRKDIKLCIHEATKMSQEIRQKLQELSASGHDRYSLYFSLG